MSQPNNQSTVEQALDNLEKIQNGEHPEWSRNTDIEIIDDDELLYRHDDRRRSRSEIDSEFVEAVNLIEPEHPYVDNLYPVTMDDMHFSYCRKSSNVWARCGPMDPSWGPDEIVQFFADKYAMGEMERERYYTVLVHEVTHVTEGRHSQGSLHNPRFWRTMADNAVTFIENWPKKFDVDRFVSYCRYDPNSSMTDRRSMTVDEQRQAVEDRILRQL